MLKTALLLAAMTALFMTIGGMAGGQQGMVIALLFALVTNFFSYWYSDSMVLKMYRAQPLSQENAPELFQMAAQLSQHAGIPQPRLYLIETDQPNAFATGRNPEHGAVAFSRGLLSMLNSDEIAGVMAHEMAHIKNRDTLTMTVTATLSGAISALANFAMFFGGRNREGERGNPAAMLLVSLLAPLAATIVQMAISRRREYAADATGAEICGNPMALASALRKIHNGSQRIDNEIAEGHPATAHLFIANPLHLRRIGGLFSTHPDMESRIAALEAIAQQMGAPRDNVATAHGPWG